MKEIAKAIMAVMKEVKGIDKSMTVGTGGSSYKGVADKDVKQIVGDAMQKCGLSILPTDVKTKTTVSRWEEKTNYGLKQKQSVFTEAETKYLLLHTSGESIELSGYGHGVDSQDKGAGKATTYALKYVLLYAFLIPTGKIDDADNTHSDNIEAPKPKKVETKPKEKKVITKDKVNDVVTWAKKNKKTLDDIYKDYTATEEIHLLLTKGLE